MGVNEISAARYNGLLNKLLEMEEGAPAPTLSPEVVATFVLESDRPEWQFLAGNRLMCGRDSVAGASSNYAQVGFLNPSMATGATYDSNVICVLETIWAYSADGATTWDLGWRSTVPSMGTADSQGSRDSRYRGSGQMEMQGVAAVASLITTQISEFISKDEATYYNLLETIGPVILAPGSYFIVRNKSEDNSIRVVASWRERVLANSERR